jgi:fumarate reductase (CoM/CoB) subunit B
VKEAAFVEMQKAREDSVCCGAGGSMKLSNNTLATDVGKTRISQAKHTGSSALVTCCPWCEQNLQDSLDEGDRFEVINIVELFTPRVNHGSDNPD